MAPLPVSLGGRMAARSDAPASPPTRSAPGALTTAGQSCIATRFTFYPDVQNFGSLFLGVSGNGNSVADARRQQATFATRASWKHVSRCRRVSCFLLVIRKLLNVAPTAGHKPTATQGHMTPRQRYRNNGKLTSLPFQWRQTDRRVENTQSDQQSGSKVKAVPLLGGST